MQRALTSFKGRSFFFIRHKDFIANKLARMLMMKGVRQPFISVARSFQDRAGCFPSKCKRDQMHRSADAYATQESKRAHRLSPLEGATDWLTESRPDQSVSQWITKMMMRGSVGLPFECFRGTCQIMMHGKAVITYIALWDPSKGAAEKKDSFVFTCVDRAS